MVRRERNVLAGVRFSRAASDSLADRIALVAGDPWRVPVTKATHENRQLLHGIKADAADVGADSSRRGRKNLLESTAKIKTATRAPVMRENVRE
jgi:hypothetical protein